MTSGRWKPTDEALAKEIFSVLIRLNKPTRKYSKAMLLKLMDRPEIYMDVLKHCLEWDHSERLDNFRKGLLLTIRAIGASYVAKEAGVSRITLYRMLAKGGNPRLSSLAAVFDCLGVRLWIVDDDFVARRTRLTRPKDEEASLKHWSSAREVRKRAFAERSSAKVIARLRAKG